MEPVKRLWNTLSEEERNLIVQAALLPPPVSLDTLTAVSGLSPVNTLRRLEGFAARGLLKAHEASGVGHSVFCSAAAAEEAVGCLGAHKVELLAAALVNHIEDSDIPPVRKSLIIANIDAVSGVAGRHPEHVLKAADYCLRQGAREAAAVYYQMALDTFSSGPHAEGYIPARIDAMLGLVASQGHRMPLRLQRVSLEASRGWAEAAGDQLRLCKVDLRLAQVSKTLGDYAAAGRLFEEAWALAGRMEGEDLKKEAALFTTEFLFWQGRVADAVARYEEVIGNLEEFPPDEGTLRACANLGWCYGICGQISRGLGLIQAVRDRALSAGLEQVKPYADLMSVLTLLEARRIPEVEVFLGDILSRPEEDVGHYILWAANAAKAYVLCWHGDLKGCFRYQKKAFEKSREFGWPHHRGPWNFEYMERLEEAGLVHPEMNCDSELARIFNWPDVYMQGVGHRYRARRLIKTGGDRAAALADLEESARLLRQAGARLELARTEIDLAREYLARGRDEDARALLRGAHQVLSAVNEDLFPNELRPYLDARQGEERLMEILIEAGEAVGTVRNRKVLLERIINLLMKLTLAGRGGFFTFGADEELELAASRNLDRSMVDSPHFRPGLEMVLEARRRKVQSLRKVPTGGDGPRPGEQRSGWALSSPVVLKERVLGVIYLDNNLVDISPPEKDLTFLRVIGNQVAVALDNARAYEEIAHLKDRLEDETHFYRMEWESSSDHSRIVGKSGSIRRVLEEVEKVAGSDASVLITGETGVGKELVARAIHGLSRRQMAPFIPVNTASLDPGVVASELFGHEKGAFTGAVRTRRGRFELADRGTLFLDDVDNLSLEIQAKILRTLQEKEFVRVGGDKTIRSDFRLIAATNQNLEELVKSGRFRSDLYYRLKVFPIHVPALRERAEDILPLAHHFLQAFAARAGKRFEGIERGHVRRLLDYAWPGNVRELKHIVERAVILSEGGMLQIPDLSGEHGGTASPGGFLTLKETERRHILEALRRCGWRVSGTDGAAEMLGLKPTTLYSRIRKLGLKKTLAYE